MKTKPDTFLHTKELHYHYPGSNWELTIDELALSSGELKSVIGPNGSGKSTLLKLLAGILPCPNNHTTVNNHSLKKLSRKEIAQTVGYLPQYIIVDYNYRVHELVEMGRYSHLAGTGYLSKNDLKITQQCMEKTGTLDLANRAVYQLSGGERQRVFLASVLAQEPSILLFDEPTSALDVHHQVEFIHIVKELCAQGIAVLLVTHDINLASTVSDKIVLMQNGSIKIEDQPEKVLIPEQLEPVYGNQLYFTTHPFEQKPWVLPCFQTDRT